MGPVCVFLFNFDAFIHSHCSAPQLYDRAAQGYAPESNYADLPAVLTYRLTYVSTLSLISASHSTPVHPTQAMP
jgi:hypothetical protein